MHHTTAMRFIQCIRDLRSQLEHLLQRQRPLLQTLGQRFALDAFHHQVVDSVLMTDVVQHADVRMIQIGDCLGFALEPLFAYGIGRKLRGQNLDSNRALQARVPRAVHFTHPARTKRCHDFVGAKPCPWSHRHNWPTL